MNIMSTDHSETVHEQAANWQARLSAGNVSATESQNFKRWLQEPENELAYSQCLLVLEMTESLKADEDILRERQTLSGTTVSESANDRWYHQPKRLVQIAAALILAIGVSVAVDYSSYQRYNTGIGEQRLVRLEDGSSILLNTDTQLKVKYTSRNRVITLAHGEAYFTVAKDRNRPFEVHAGSSIARALGTQFSVALLPQSVDSKEVSVAVTEGVVEVEADTTAHKNSVIAQLGIGDAINFSDTTLPQKPEISSADIARIDAWQQRKIYFNADTLADAISEYNRYSQVKFHIIDQELGNERITGLFNVGDLDAFIYSLEQLLNINVVQNRERIFLIKKA